MQCISGLGIVVFNLKDVFAVPKCQVSTGLTYVRPVSCLTCQFIYDALSWSSVVSWVLGLVICCSAFVLLKANFMSVCLKRLITFQALEL